ncbi:iron ABC transporter permease, partial [Bacillus cereus]
MLLALCAASVSLGAGQLSLSALWGAGEDAERAWRLLMVSRIPRTLALLLAGMSLAVAGLIMQMLVRNRY